MRPLIALSLALVFSACDSQTSSTTCNGLVEFGMAYIGATDGVSDVAVVDVAGHGRVLYQVLGTRDARPIPGVRGQVLDVTFAFTANDPLRSDRAVLVAAGVSADEAGRVGPREFLRFDERVVRGVNTFRYMVEVPDFQVLQGNEPCIPTR